MPLPALCRSHERPGGGSRLALLLLCLPLRRVHHDSTIAMTATITTAATNTMPATSTVTVPTAVTATATTMAAQRRARQDCKQRHLHGVRWGHGGRGFPGQGPPWDPAQGGHAGLGGRERRAWERCRAGACGSQGPARPAEQRQLRTGQPGAPGAAPRGLRGQTCTVSPGCWSQRGARGTAWGSRRSLPQPAPQRG